MQQRMTSPALSMPGTDKAVQAVGKAANAAAAAAGMPGPTID